MDNNIVKIINEMIDRKLRQLRLDATKLSSISGDSWTNGGVVTKPAVEAVLTGEITSHGHADNVLTGTAAPTTATVGTVGQFYVDTAGQALYYCLATSGGVYTWVAAGTLTQATETALGGIKAKAKSTEDQEIAIDGTTGKLYAPAGGYTLPQTTESALGGIKAKAKTTETGEVAVDAATGKLYAPVGSGSSPLTAKGDLYARSATADARLPVGSNGQVLVADSAQANGLRWSNVGYAIDAPPSSPSAYDDEFNDSSVNAAWSWLNQGTSTATEDSDKIKLSIQGNSASGIRGLVKACPSGNFTVIAKLLGCSRLGNYPKEAVIVGESLSGKQFAPGVCYTSLTAQTLAYDMFTTPTSRGSYGSNVGTLFTVYIKAYVYYTTAWYVDLYHSPNGVVWSKHSTTALGFTPGYIGIGANNEGVTTTDDFYFDWFRVTQ